MFEALPTWKPPADHGRRPRVLRQLSAELTRVLAIPGNELRRRLRQVDLHNGDQRSREMYQPRLEACAIFLQALLHYTDVVTLVAGKAEDGEFFGVRLDKLSQLTGLHERRVDRVVRDLHAAGFLVSKTRAERLAEDQGYRGLTAVRQISAELFWALGLGPLLEKARKRYYTHRQRKLQARQAPLQAALGRMATLGREFANAASKRRNGASLSEVLAKLNFTPP